MTSMNFASLFSAAVEATKPGSRPVPAAAGLSDEQMAALSAPFDKSSLVCAGAGAGKTRVLSERVALLLKLGAVPSRMAVVTFTRKAAAEMSSRVAGLVLDKRRMPVIGTVHALALSVATRRRLDFQLANEQQQHECLQDLVELLPPEFESLDLDELLLEIGRAREGDELGSTAGLLARIYEEKLLARGLGDFTSLLARAGDKTLDMFDHVLVDESQDLSVLQLAFLRAIGPRAKFWFIGDPDQAIYSFRGAHSSMMHRLLAESDLRFDLTTNYRSSKAVVTHANNVIVNNPGRMDLRWTAHRKEQGFVAVNFHDHGEHELAAAEAWVKEAPAKRCVLSRTRSLIASLKAQALPAYTVHESKGLEWDEVYVMGCEAAMFPHPLAAQEEERRLFYVAMTRARDSLVLSLAATRSSKNPLLATRSPSKFLFETQALEAKS